MPKELFDEDQNPIEAFTKEEVDQKVEETRKEVEEEKKEEVENLNTDIGKLKEDMEKLDDKDHNFKNLREAKEAKEKEVEELQGELKTLKEDGSKKTEGAEEIINRRLREEKLSQKIEILSGGNKEIADQIRFHFKGFKEEDEKDPIKREESLLKKIEDAYLLATGSKPVNLLTGNIVSSAGGGVPPSGGASKGKLSESARNMGKEKFGLSEDELKGAEEKGLI